MNEWIKWMKWINEMNEWIEWNEWTKTLKAKTSKTKTPEYLLDESFVFVYFPTVHLSCQCGMSKKC